MPKPALRMDAQEIGTYWANRWQPLREVGGRLMLTDQRLVFYAHMIDRATGGEDWACELAAIIGVEASERRSTFRRRRLWVHSDESTEQFLVNKVDRVVDAINSARGG